MRCPKRGAFGRLRYLGFTPKIHHTWPRKGKISGKTFILDLCVMSAASLKRNEEYTNNTCVKQCFSCTYFQLLWIAVGQKRQTFFFFLNNTVYCRVYRVVLPAYIVFTYYRLCVWGTRIARFRKNDKIKVTLVFFGICKRIS